MNDDLLPVRNWRIGELSTGLQSREEILALVQSFRRTEFFLDAVECVLERVDVVFNLRPISEEGILSFLEPPPHRNEVSLITNKLEVLYLAWQLASKHNPAVASFLGDTLRKLQAEIRLVNRDAINAACNGYPLQKLKAAMNSRKDITNAFYRVNRELGIHRAEYELAELIRKTHGKTELLLTADEQTPSSHFPKVEQLEHPKMKLPTNPDIAEVLNLVSGGMQTAPACRQVAERTGSNATSLRTQVNRYRRKNIG